MYLSPFDRILLVSSELSDESWLFLIVFCVDVLRIDNFVIASSKPRINIRVRGKQDQYKHRSIEQNKQAVSRDS